MTETPVVSHYNKKFLSLKKTANSLRLSQAGLLTSRRFFFCDSELGRCKVGKPSQDWGFGVKLSSREQFKDGGESGFPGDVQTCSRTKRNASWEASEPLRTSLRQDCFSSGLAPLCNIPDGGFLRFRIWVFAFRTFDRMSLRR